MTFSKKYLDSLPDKETALQQYFIDCCNCGMLEHIKYLLTQHRLKDTIKINGDNDSNVPLNSACGAGRLSVVKYLTSSEDLSQRADIYLNNCSCFRLACLQEKHDVMNYLLFDLEMILPDDFKIKLFDSLGAVEKPQSYLDTITALFQKQTIFLALNCNLENKSSSKAMKI